MTPAVARTVREQVTRRHASPVTVAVPRLFPGGTIVCIGTGPSLTQADVTYVRGKATAVIAVNDAYKLAPWADVLFACDHKWWYWHKDAAAFAGLKYTLDPRAAHLPGVCLLRNTGEVGLELQPIGLRNGRNSGFQSIGLAVHLGAARILLLGFDMKGDHYFGHHPDQSRPPFAVCLKRFQTLVKPLRELGIEIVNCTPGSALKCFPMARLQDVLPCV